jgi:hypothetical protein
MKKEKEIFELYLDLESDKEYFHAPFIRDDYVYASNMYFLNSYE